MDIIPVELVNVPASVVVAWKVASLGERALGPPLDAIGQAGKDYIEHLHYNLMSRVRGGYAYARASKREISDVRPKLKVPIIQGASVEEDPDLCAMWEALIANAMTQTAGQEMGPRFPRILQELTPTDATILAFLHQHPEPPPEKRKRPEYDPGEFEVNYWDRSDVAERTGIAPRDLDAACDTLFGLGVVEREPSLRINMSGSASMSDTMGVSLSELGRRFVVACTPPTPISVQT